MLGTFRNVDRLKEEQKAEPVDGIMMTLDAEKYLEKTLDAMYAEVPIQQLFVIDGGSKDKTLDILRNYPRVNLEVLPNVTLGKCWEILINRVSTPWFVFIDCGKIPAKGWYDEMVKYKDKYDYYGSKRIVHYEFEREDPTTTDMEKRPLGGPWIIRKKSVEHYHVDDDYAWRIIDIILRDVVEKNGYTYGAVSTTSHICYVTEGERYVSDEKKKGSALIFKKPELKVYNKKNMDERMEITVKAIVKYVDPEISSYFCTDHTFIMISKLDQKWIESTNKKWLDALHHWKRRKYIKAKIPRMLYSWYKSITNKIDEKVEKVVEKYDENQ
jgi:glycosyltransferase involved in cell wall biosynthesis